MLEPQLWPVIREQDLNELVQQTYGQPFIWQQQEFFSNDSLHAIEAFPSKDWEHDGAKDWWAEETKALAAWADEAPPPKDDPEYWRWKMDKEREPGVSAVRIWSDLVDRGLLAAGEHYVYVSW